MPADVIALPTHDDAFVRAASVSGMDAEVLRRAARQIDVDAYDVRAMLEEPDAAARLRRLPERAEAHVSKEIRRVLPTAPFGAVADPALLELVPPACRAIARDWVPRSGGLLLLGPTGIGKSATATYIARRLARARIVDRKGGGARWASAIDLANATARSPLGVVPEVIGQAKAAAVLVLDDLGWQERDGAVAEVIAARYDGERQTIVTSGQPWPALVERYSEAMLRRLLESGGVRGRIVSLFVGSGGKAAG